MRISPVNRDIDPDKSISISSHNGCHIIRTFQAVIYRKSIDESAVTFTSL
jgi:hypothetical protein